MIVATGPLLNAVATHALEQDGVVDHSATRSVRILTRSAWQLGAHCLLVASDGRKPYLKEYGGAMACAYLAWDPKALAGSVVGGRFRLEHLLHASNDAVTYSATDVQASRAVVVELSARPVVEQRHSASRARTLDEGFTVQGWHYVVLEQTADLREWKLVQCHGESLAATFWQTADGSLLVELPVQIWEAQGTIPRATSSAAARSPVSSPDLPRPPACGSSAASRDCFTSDDYDALTPVTPIALPRSRALCELSPDDRLPLEVPELEIPVYVELPADPRDTERPVVREVYGRDSDAPTPTRSRRTQLMLTGTLCVACALVGWRGAWHLLPAIISAGPPGTAAVGERRATATRAQPIELRSTIALPVPSAPATGAVPATATARSRATPPEQSPLARRPVASKRPRRANSAVASRTDRETPPPNLKNPYIFAPREL